MGFRVLGFRLSWELHGLRVQYLVCMVKDYNRFPEEGTSPEFKELVRTLFNKIWREYSLRWIDFSLLAWGIIQVMISEHVFNLLAMC